MTQINRICSNKTEWADRTDLWGLIYPIALQGRDQRQQTIEHSHSHAAHSVVHKIKFIPNICWKLNQKYPVYKISDKSRDSWTGASWAISAGDVVLGHSIFAYASILIIGSKSLSWKYSLYGVKNGRHAFGNNSAKSEMICIKSGTMWAKCWRLALPALADFWALSAQ